MPSATDNYMPFGKELCYCVLADTEALLMGLEKNTHLELPIMGWIMSESPILSQIGPQVVHYKMKTIHFGLI